MCIIPRYIPENMVYHMVYTIFYMVYTIFDMVYTMWYHIYKWFRPIVGSCDISGFAAMYRILPWYRWSHVAICWCISHSHIIKVVNIRLWWDISDKRVGYHMIYHATLCQELGRCGSHCPAAPEPPASLSQGLDWTVTSLMAWPVCWHSGLLA